MSTSANPIPTSTVLDPETPFGEHEIAPQTCPLVLDTKTNADIFGDQNNQVEIVKALSDLSISESHQLAVTMASDFNTDISVKEVEEHAKQVQDLETRVDPDPLIDGFHCVVAKLESGFNRPSLEAVTSGTNKKIQVQDLEARIANMEIRFNLLSTRAGICNEKIITNELALNAQLAQIRPSQFERNEFMATEALKESCVLANKVMNLEAETSDLQTQLDLNYITLRGHGRVLQRIIDTLHLDIDIAAEIDFDPAVENNPPLPNTPSTGNDWTAVDQPV
ncbi:uncharacterized protein MELLADRAFT_67325 [Melampsora larici-populina 98AG31]|uniref:Uncharacterized protein n=1 Tax=Melampsora larici-populina (strain 98AG31 / pathotype 3-4-7) TaxID=747676 RepID=F4S2P0_MELLP|nr:uncharacterized protein MELLADRAFT_67325 [Melampsora larici-populina 98AG31]EGG01033.1 hypothetical protein MELLADRAFT_67325 [Melampsora larici-populina 98AG31]